MNKNTYIGQILTEHLLTDTYRKLTANEAKNIMETVRSTLKNLISNNQDKFSIAEITYF